MFNFHEQQRRCTGKGSEEQHLLSGRSIRPITSAHQLRPFCLIECDDKSPYSFKAEFNYCDVPSVRPPRSDRRGGGAEPRAGEPPALGAARRNKRRIIHAEGADKSIIQYSALSMINAQNRPRVFGSNHWNKSREQKEERLTASACLGMRRNTALKRGHAKPCFKKQPLMNSKRKLQVQKLWRKQLWQKLNDPGSCWSVKPQSWENHTVHEENWPFFLAKSLQFL